MTAMRTGIYTLLAVVIGVMLVGMLPGQLSSIAAPKAVTILTLPSTSVEGKNDMTRTLTGVLNDTTALTGSNDSATAAQAASISADAAKTATSSSEFSNVTDPYSEVRYYGLWGIGLIVALSVYFVSKRLLG